MNERLLEFAEQAEEYASIEYKKRKTGYDRQYFFETKFAELIIIECANIVDNDSTLIGIVGEDLKEHFGIK